VIGAIYPTKPRPDHLHGTYLKGLGFSDLLGPFASLLLAVPVLGVVVLLAHETGDLSDAAPPNVVQLASRSLWSLAREPRHAAC